MCDYTADPHLRDENEGGLLSHIWVNGDNFLDLAVGNLDAV